jgi:hypothetical protein
VLNNTGRWWLVGSAWTGNGDSKANASSTTTEIAKKSDIAEFGDISADLQVSLSLVSHFPTPFGVLIAMPFLRWIHRRWPNKCV